MSMVVRCSHDELVSLNELLPHPKNRNKHPSEQVERLAKILAYQGWRYPVKVSKLSGKVTSGHGRIEAARANGWTHAPVSYQEYDTEEQEYADVQADNAIASWSELDLSGINADVGELGPDFDLDMLGIKDFVLEPAELIPQADEDAVPEHVEPKAKLGDIYQLGRHRLMCGDSTSIDAVDALMAGEKADMVFTDPPYNHASDDKGVAAGVSKAHKKLMDSEWDKNFEFVEVGACLLTAISENCAVYVCTSHRLVGEILDWMKNAAAFHGLCVWHKPNPMPSLMKRHWTWAHELVCYATFGKQVFNFPDTGHAPSVWTFTKKSDGTHPTQKPVEVCEHAITHSSNVNQLVLDLFGGSGSTLIACEKTNRRCFMMELDPHYVDVIVTRWEQYTGQKAELVNV